MLYFIEGHDVVAEQALPEVGSQRKAVSVADWTTMDQMFGAICCVRTIKEIYNGF